VEDDRRALRRARLPEERDRAVQQGALEGPAEAFPPLGQLLGPARGLVGEQTEGVSCRRLPPEPEERARGDPVRLLLVAKLPQPGARLAALGEERPAAPRPRPEAGRRPDLPSARARPARARSPARGS